MSAHPRPMCATCKVRPVPKGRRRFCSDVCQRSERREQKMCEVCGVRPVGPKRRRFCDDDCARRARRLERVREPAEYVQALLRMIRKTGEMRAFDQFAFAKLVELDERMHTVLTAMARQLIAEGYSWGEIGRACGMTRQAARQRWGRPDQDEAVRQEAS